MYIIIATTRTMLTVDTLSGNLNERMSSSSMLTFI